MKAGYNPHVGSTECGKFLTAGPTCLLGHIHQHTPDGTELTSPDAAVELCQSESQGNYYIHLRPSESWPQTAALQDGSLEAGPRASCLVKWEINQSWLLFGTRLYIHVIQPNSSTCKFIKLK